MTKNQPERSDRLDGLVICRSRQFKKIMIENLVRSEEWFDQVMVKAQQVVKDDRYFREQWKFKLLEELKRLGARGWRP